MHSTTTRLRTEARVRPKDLEPKSPGPNEATMYYFYVLLVSKVDAWCEQANVRLWLAPRIPFLPNNFWCYSIS